MVNQQAGYGYPNPNNEQTPAVQVQPLYAGAPMVANQPEEAKVQDENVSVQTPYGYAVNLPKPQVQPLYAGTVAPAKDDEA